MVSYYEATGVLVLDRDARHPGAVRRFALDEYHRRQQAYIAQIAGPPIRNGRTCSMAWKVLARNSAFRCRTTKDCRSAAARTARRALRCR